MIAEAATAVMLAKASCAWGATRSAVGCLAPYTKCTRSHTGAYRRHGYACVQGYLRYDYSLLRKRTVRKPACEITGQHGTLKRNGYARVRAWGSPASPWMPTGSLEGVPVDPDTTYSTDWGGFKAMWAIDPLYVGPVLIRGRQLDGDDVLRFEKGEPGFYEAQGRNPLYELHESGGYVHPAVTRVRTPGCYAYQVDGIGFSYSIVFRTA